MSANNPVIVSGEAPETDSEEEASNRTISPGKTTIHGAVIIGEDSESEHEPEVKEDIVKTPHSESDRSQVNKNYNSLLHRKLKECNLKLKWDLEVFVQSNIGEASKTLHIIEQELINSQLTVQSAISSLQTLHANSAKINAKMQSILSSSFLSNIKV